MNKTHFALRAITLFAFTLAISMVANAQATRTWVSGVGDDANPCSRTAPCKTFAGAISKTFIGGEIDALDPGGFGTVTITKSITIDGGSTFASVLASGVNGIIVNVAAGNGNDPERRVTLRRLSITGTGNSGTVGLRTGLKGISISNALSVHVENCYIQAFSQEGINMSVAENLDTLSVKDTNIQNCNVGVNMVTTTGSLLGLFDRVRIEKITTNGIAIGVHSHITVRQSEIVNNGGDGITVNAGASDSTVFTEGATVSHNNTGIRNGANGSSVILSNTNIQGNFTGLATAGGVFTSHGNNEISGNGSPGTAAGVIGQQ